MKIVANEVGRMPKGEVTVKFECPLCGGTVIDLPDNFTDDSSASCATRGCNAHFGRWGDIKDRTRRAVAKAVAENFHKDPRRSFTKH